MSQLVWIETIDYIECHVTEILINVVSVPDVLGIRTSPGAGSRSTTCPGFIRFPRMAGIETIINVPFLDRLVGKIPWTRSSLESSLINFIATRIQVCILVSIKPFIVTPPSAVSGDV